MFSCLAYASRRTSRAVTNFFNARMKPLDLNVSQFGLLAAIAREPGRSLSSISEGMLLDESTMVRNLTVLERRGLVASEGGRGRGGKQVALTREGEKLFRAASKVWVQTNVELETEIGSRAAAAGHVFMTELGEAAERLKLLDEQAMLVAK